MDTLFVLCVDRYVRMYVVENYNFGNHTNLHCLMCHTVSVCVCVCLSQLMCVQKLA